MSEEARAKARANLVWTYTELARQVPAAILARLSEGWTCSAHFEMPFCNFGIGLSIDTEPRASANLLEIEAHRLKSQSYRIFCLTEAEDSKRTQTLSAAGYRPAGKLCHLACEPKQEFGPDVEEVVTDAERMMTTEFMAKQFFWRQSEPLRRSIAEATARSPHRLFRYQVKGQWIGGFMLSQTEEAIGLYNVCVANEWRNQGYGQVLVAAALREGAELKLPVFLQCDASLRRWYEGFGFRSQGQIETFSRIF